MSFKTIDELSPSLNQGIQFYIERLDMSQRDRELFYDILRFSFDEGKISGKEEYLREMSNENEKTNN